MLSITYDARGLQDGVGAQAQRVIGIYAIAKFFRIGYLHTEIEEILIHRGDGVQTPLEYRKLLDQVNSMVRFESNIGTYPNEVIELTKLNAREFFGFYFKYRFSKEHVLLRVLIPDQLLNRFPTIISKFMKISRSSGKEVLERIGVHVRQSGNSQNFVLKGESQSRQLYANYYLKALEEISDKYSERVFESMELMVFTDESSHEDSYTPFKGQTHMWKEAGYPVEENQILFEPVRIVESILDRYPHAQIVRGGNPVLAIEMLSQSRIIVMSKSSLSITAALLSTARDIYFPNDFWYPRILKHISQK